MIGWDSTFSSWVLWMLSGNSTTSSPSASPECLMGIVLPLLFVLPLSAVWGQCLLYFSWFLCVLYANGISSSFASPWCGVGPMSPVYFLFLRVLGGANVSSLPSAFLEFWVGPMSPVFFLLSQSVKWDQCLLPYFCFLWVLGGSNFFRLLSAFLRVLWWGQCLLSSLWFLRVLGGSIVSCLLAAFSAWFDEANVSCILFAFSECLMCTMFHVFCLVSQSPEWSKCLLSSSCFLWVLGQALPLPFLIPLSACWGQQFLPFFCFLWVLCVVSASSSLSFFSKCKWG